MALYGAVPLMLGHRDSGATAGIFWFNAAETWIDIVKEQLPQDNVSHRYHYYEITMLTNTIINLA
jgi:alpha-glucosidase (family GH31 glycosyl hydrolase)